MLSEQERPSPQWPHAHIHTKRARPGLFSFCTSVELVIKFIWIPYINTYRIIIIQSIASSANAHSTASKTINCFKRLLLAPLFMWGDDQIGAR